MWSVVSAFSLSENVLALYSDSKQIDGVGKFIYRTRIKSRQENKRYTLNKLYALFSEKNVYVYTLLNAIK